MLRDFPYIIGIMFMGIIMIVFSGVYYQSNYKQDSVVQGLQETVRTSVISNADNSSRLKEGELFVSKEQFEENFKQNVQNNSNVNVSEEATYEFEYLDNKDGATKAIRVFIKDGKTTYQSTVKVNISDS